MSTLTLVIPPLDNIALINLVGAKVRKKEQMGIVEEEEVEVEGGKGEVVKGGGRRVVKGRGWRLCGF